MSMGTWNPQWEATEPLDGAPKHLNRQVGVTIGRPFHHHGLNATYVDIQRETPRVNTDTWGSCYPVEELRTRTREAFNETIADLDRLIWHLAGHRDRLKAELETLAERDFEETIPRAEVQPSIDASIAPTPAVVDVHLPESA